MNTTLISILIPTIKRDEVLLRELIYELSNQIKPHGSSVQILIDDDEYESIGKKRNKLLSRATGKYVAYFDSDDKPSNEYIDLLIMAAKSGADCASLKGVYSIDGVFDGLFEHSLKYSEWRTTANEIKYERYPNHLSLIKADIAKQFKFPEINHGEDADWSTQIHNSGLLKTEHYIPEIIYYYNKITTK